MFLLFLFGTMHANVLVSEDVRIDVGI